MIAKLSTLLAVAVVGGALLAGCGSSGSKPTSNASTPTGLTRTVTPHQAVVDCKHAIEAQKLQGSVKAKLFKICEKAATADQNTLHQLVKQVCVELINASHVPLGPQRERALAVCSVK
jgi:hypothetical protein